MTNSTARYILFFSLLSMVNTAGPDVQAAEEVDPMQVQVEPSVDVVETWQLGPCGLSGKREGARLVNASGVCGSMQFFASRLSREPAQADDGLRLVDGTLQAPDWTMKSQMLFVGFSGSNLVLESPGVGEKE
jgi:hypothetical protein